MNNIKKLIEEFFNMLEFSARTKKEKSIRNTYALTTVAVLIFFPASYFYIRDMMPGTGQGGS